MQIHYRITSPIRAILKRWDWLGFDTEKQAAEAILTNEDWAGRWDLSDADVEDMQDIDKWKEAALEESQKLFEYILHPLFNDIMQNCVGL